MDRARKAETVAPALELRDSADTEHRRASAAEQRSAPSSPCPWRTPDRTGSPPRPAAPPRLGGLESARRAERRLTELLDERAGLDRQERADEEVREDAEAWLAGWEATRTALQDRIATAQQAATRAGELAARRDTARHRLAAARTRDRLTRDAEAAAEQADAAREQALAARQHWLDLKEQRLGGIAAELAAGLTDGAPCAVCGATEHPAPPAGSPDTSTARPRNAPSPPTSTPRTGAPKRTSGSAPYGRSWPPRARAPGHPGRPARP